MYKEFFAKKKLITFDLDGTTVSSEKVWDLAFRTVAKMLNLSPESTGISGNTVADRWKNLVENNEVKNSRPIKELVDLTHNEFIKHLDKLELTEGFWPFVAELKVLKKLKLALVTNTSRVITDRVIAQLELREVFDFVLCADEVKMPKPSPELYKKTLEHFNMKPNEVLAFEDSLMGCIAAAKAGIKILCIWNQAMPKRCYPDEVLDFAGDFTPFPGEMDTTYFEDIKQLAKEQEAAGKLSV